MRVEKLKYHKYNIFFNDFDKNPTMQINYKDAKQLVTELGFVLRTENIKILTKTSDSASQSANAKITRMGKQNPQDNVWQDGEWQDTK